MTDENTSPDIELAENTNQAQEAQAEAEEPKIEIAVEEKVEAKEENANANNETGTGTGTKTETETEAAFSTDANANMNNTGAGELRAELGEESLAAKAKKFTQRECVIYFIFLIVFIIMAILSRGDGDLSYTQTVAIRNPMVNDLFQPWNYDAEKSFEQTTTITDIYNFLSDVAVPLLLSDNRDGTHYVQQRQILLGGIRLRQSRRKTAKCEINKFNRDTENYESNCFAETELTKNKITFDSADGLTSKQYHYFSADDLDDQSWRASYGSYPGGGYYVDFINTSQANTMLATLQEIAWIDAQTRYVGIDFNTYDPSSTLHTLCRVAWEMPSGGVFPTDEFKTWKFDRYTQSSGKALMAFHVIFIIMLVAMSISTGLDMYRETCWKCGIDPDTNVKYYWRVTRWRYFDCANLIFFYLSVIFFIYNQSQFNRTDVYDLDEYVSLRSLQYGFTMEAYMTAINALLLVLKLFKFLAVNRRLQFLFMIFRRAGYDLMVFGVVLFVFFFAFGFAGFLTFSSDVDDFRSLTFAMGNMLRYTVSDMDYTSLKTSSPMWGSLFYFAWSLLMILVLVNVFIAILSDAYSQVQLDLSAEDKVSFGFGTAFAKLGKMFGSFRLVTQAHEALDLNQDGVVDIDEFIQMNKCDRETAQQFFDKYDADNSGGLSPEEYEKAKAELEEERAQAEREAQNAARMRLAGGSSPGGGRRGGGGGGVGVEAAALMVAGFGGGGGYGVAPKEWKEMKEDMTDVKTLLMEVLQTTKVGRSVLQKRDSMKN